MAGLVIASAALVGDAQGQRSSQLSAAESRTPPGINWPAPPLPDGPIMLETAEARSLRVVVMAKQLNQPWSIAFLPDGAILVTERPGRLRIFRNGVLDPAPVAGVPAVRAADCRADGRRPASASPRTSGSTSYHKPVGTPVPPARGTVPVAPGGDDDRTRHVGRDRADQ